LYNNFETAYFEAFYYLHNVSNQCKKIRQIQFIKIPNNSDNKNLFLLCKIYYIFTMQSNLKTHLYLAC